jgi:hypothetical protein
MHTLCPFPVPDHQKELQTRFFVWCEAGTCRARCCVTGTGAQQWGNWQGGSRVSQLKLRAKATEPAQNPLIQIVIEFFSYAKGGSLFQSGCQGVQAVVVDHVTGAFSRSARHQQTCNHASKQAANKNCFNKALKKCIFCVYWSHAGVLKSASVRTIGTWARTCRWCCGLYPRGVLHSSGLIR